MRIYVITVQDQVTYYTSTIVWATIANNKNYLFRLAVCIIKLKIKCIVCYRWVSFQIMDVEGKTYNNVTKKFYEIMSQGFYCHDDE